MSEHNIVDAIEQLNYALEKIQTIEPEEFELSNKIMDNRIITLEGYLRYLETEGIPKLKEINNHIEEENNDRSDIL
ncbi:MAG: hypothetical protein ACOC4G_04985 [Bacillota bacterium]